MVGIPETKIDSLTKVIVKIGCSGVCRTDLHIIEAVWREALGNPPLPYTIGHENAGWIEEVGSAVTTLKKGDPAILHPLRSCGLCRACRAGYDMYCEHGNFPGLDGTDGGYAEYLKTSVRLVFQLAPGTDPVPLAPFADAGITAYHAVKRLPRFCPKCSPFDLSLKRPGSAVGEARAVTPGIHRELEDVPVVSESVPPRLCLTISLAPEWPTLA